jgi:hypothetical protein
VSAPVIFVWSTVGLWPLPTPPAGCRLCGAALKVWERPERECDVCLRLFAWR